MSSLLFETIITWLTYQIYTELQNQLLNYNACKAHKILEHMMICPLTQISITSVLLKAIIKTSVEMNLSRKCWIVSLSLACVGIIMNTRHKSSVSIIILRFIIFCFADRQRLPFLPITESYVGCLQNMVFNRDVVVFEKLSAVSGPVNMRECPANLRAPSPQWTYFHCSRIRSVRPEMSVFPNCVLYPCLIV